LLPSIKLKVAVKIAVEEFGEETCTQQKIQTTITRSSTFIEGFAADRKLPTELPIK
jgi:hypothetical protein